jgi:hypothetical protein
MLDFEALNRMVAKREDKPDDLCLAEEVAWQGLRYVYALFGMNKYTKDECTAIKNEIGREYAEHVRRFEGISHDMDAALALFQMAKKSDDESVTMLLKEVMSET